MSPRPTRSVTPLQQKTSALTVALGEYDTGWHNAPASLSRAREIARNAKAAGADVLLLPEMFATGFTMEAAEFAEPESGPIAKQVSGIAAEHELWILAGISVRKPDGRFVNTAMLFSPRGEATATYEKQRLFVYANENEIYSSGEQQSIVEINEVRAGVLICFDLRFPELFREIAPDVDAFFLIANWPQSRQHHWDVLTRARAIENQCYMVAVNRTGEGGGLQYAGGSVAYDPSGNRCDEAVPNSSLRIARLSTDAVHHARKSFPISSFVQRAPISSRAT
ncbi:MAG TPA: nitrilase-related carbon-nitrogen hydrolase [Gemmatimonadaceae bacterium]|nr:nitrilase-related carbon-nitrogen hydrolase [Gemmatimonadaceae bacterium]